MSSGSMAIPPIIWASRHFSDMINYLMDQLSLEFKVTPMAKQPPNAGKRWTPAKVKHLAELAKGNTPTRVIGIKLGRTPESVESKASDEGISLKPTNQSPYGNRH